MKNRTLYVPANVSLRNEVWRGLSVADSVRCIVNGAIAAAIGAALHFTMGAEIIWCVLGAMIVASASVVVLQRFDSGLSIMDYVKIMLKYKKEQKRYLYIYRRNQ